MRRPILAPILVFMFALTCAAAFHAGHACADDVIELTVQPSFAGYFRPGHFMALRITAANNTDQPADARLIVSSDTTIINQRLHLPAPSARELTVLPVPQSLHPFIDIRLAANGRVAGRDRIAEVRAVPQRAVFAALIGDTLPRYKDLIAQLPADSVLAPTQLNILPDSPAGYDPLDLLIVDDLSAQPDRQRQAAITTWLNGGGRLLVILPAGGLGAVTPYWRELLPAPVNSTRSAEMASWRRSLQSRGATIYTDDDHEGLLGYNVGSGRIVISGYGHSLAIATAESRKQISEAAVRLLGLDKPLRRTPGLIVPNVYELFPHILMPSAVRRAAGIAAIGYAIAMSIVVIAIRRRSPAAIAIWLVASTAVFALLIWGIVLPRSTLVMQAATIARTSTGAASVSAERYLNVRSFSDDPFSLKLDLPTKPIFFSETMLQRGPLLVRRTDHLDTWDIPAGTGRLSCFRQSDVIAKQVDLIVENTGQDIYTITCGTNVSLKDAILTDGTFAVFVGDLQAGTEREVDFSPPRRARLNRLAWDRLAERSPERLRVLQFWMSQGPLQSRLAVVGWNETQVMPHVPGRFLARSEYDVLYLIDIEQAPTR